jgi:hypothetical protein
VAAVSFINCSPTPSINRVSVSFPRGCPWTWFKHGGDKAWVSQSRRSFHRTPIGISGYPEGHPEIGNEKLWQASREKQAAILERGHDFAVVTQTAGDRRVGPRLPGRIWSDDVMTVRQFEP